MSLARLAAAIWTPGHSSAERYIGDALPFATTGKVDVLGVKLTQGSWPMASTQLPVKNATLENKKENFIVRKYTGGYHSPPYSVRKRKLHDKVFWIASASCRGIRPKWIILRVKQSAFGAGTAFCQK